MSETTPAAPEALAQQLEGRAAEPWSVCPFIDEAACEHERGVLLTVEEYAAAIQALRGQAWRDIATAPKDGTTVLLYREVAPFTVVGYGRWEEAFGISGWISYGFHRGGDDASNLGLASPTHWQPLPAPPARPQEGAQP